MISNISAVILAGGKSSRIGKDKAMLAFNGIPIIERIFNLLKSIFSDVLIIANNPTNYKYLTQKIYKDIYPGFGPLSGIHSGLIHSKTESNFIISCDMPLVNEDLIKFIISKISEKHVILPRANNRIHSLCGIYKKSCIPSATELLEKANGSINKNGKTKIKLFDLINSVSTDFIDVGDEDFYVEDLFFNMNTLEDYQKLK